MLTLFESQRNLQGSTRHLAHEVPQKKKICKAKMLKRSFQPPNLYLYMGGFLKWWYPTTMGFSPKNDHFVVFWGYHPFKETPIWECSMLSIIQPYWTKRHLLFRLCYNFFDHPARFFDLCEKLQPASTSDDRSKQRIKQANKPTNQQANIYRHQ